MAEVGWFLHRSCFELFCDFFLLLFFVSWHKSIPLKIILLLVTELGLSFFSDNQQIKDHVGDVPGSLSSFLFPEQPVLCESCKARGPTSRAAGGFMPSAPRGVALKASSAEP